MINKTGKCLFLATALLFFLRLGAQAQERPELSTLPKLVLEAKKNGNLKLADTLAQVYIREYLFKLKSQDLFGKDNLTFMSEHLMDTKGKAFKLFLKQPEKVNEVLGKDKAQYALRNALSFAYFQGIDPVSKPNFDWTTLRTTMISKFGDIGLEMLYSKQMMYYLAAKDWGNFGKYYVLYFQKALKRPEYEVNNISYVLFQNVMDKKVLDFACDSVMKYAMKEWYQTDAAAYDTYANLLYKAGRIIEAIEWQKKAVEIAKGTPHENENIGHLQEMLRGEKTWL